MDDQRSDAGSFGGVSFKRVGHLVGAADTKDTYTLGALGSLSAGLDGGARGFDSLVVSGRRGVITTTAVDPSTGTLTIDGTVLRYTGLEPIAIIGSEVHVSGTAGNDTIHVSVSGTTLSVSSPTIETLNLATPGLTKLVIDGLGGVDSITFDTDLLLPGMVLDVTAETITVGAVVINTTGGASNGAVHLRAVATADGTGSAVITTAPGATISLTGATIRSGSIIDRRQRLLDGDDHLADRPGVDHLHRDGDDQGLDARVVRRHPRLQHLDRERRPAGRRLGRRTPTRRRTRPTPSWTSRPRPSRA